MFKTKHDQTLANTSLSLHTPTHAGTYTQKKTEKLSDTRLLLGFDPTTMPLSSNFI